MNIKKIKNKKYFLFKRIFDIIFSILLIICLFPLFLLISLGIKISSFKGPIIYKQNRLGKNGKTFTFYKFRSMHHNSELLLYNLLKSNHLAKKEWSIYQKLKNDPRIFFFGKLIRKTSLDELPQLWNIIKGDLSFIGPRPYLESQKDFFKDIQYIIFSIKPGLTGLWQIKGRNKTNFKKRLLLDKYYVENVCFSLDLKIFLQTLYKVFYFSHAA